jgi:hypothetical protein
MSSIPDFLSNLNEDDAASADKVDRLREKVREAHDLELLISDLEERLKAAKKDLQHIQHKELPDLMDEARVTSLTVAASGNGRPFMAMLSPFYSANIAAGWDEGRKQVAFQYLTEQGAGDLIKTKVEIDMPREKREEALQLAESLSEDGLPVSLKEGVHAQTLTAWLREQVEQNQTLPDLEKIGGVVGRVVKIKVAK